MMGKMGICDWISWLIGLVAAVVVYVASVEAVTWIPALLIAIAVGCFLGLVLRHLFCRRADMGAEHAAPAIVEEAVAEAESGALDAGATAAGIDPAEAAAEKAKLDAAIAAEKAEAEAAAAIPDYDKDGVHEGANEGAQPEALSGPRDGKADNLKEIKGIGPKLEKLCNDLGFYHFDQIAGWTADEVAWVDANLQGFRGRVSRDNWVEQAKILAAGGETEFSQRVDEGKVY